MGHSVDSEIVVRGAREHNLRSVDLTIPRGSLVCFTGVSGSGKSSLAFDTLYAEGQRRYLESLSSYARQFIGQLPKPDVDFLSGLSPSISISQKSTGNNPRSTVGTITEINDFLRVLYARVGTGFCPKCDVAITAQTRDQIIARVLQLDSTTSYAILAPMIRGQKGEHRDLFDDLRKQGFGRARVNGQIVSLTNPPTLERQLRHTIEAVVDRVDLASCGRQRLAEAIDNAIRLGEGTMIAFPLSEEESPTKKKSRDIVFSANYVCPECGESFPPPSPQLLSFNSPQGMCPGCDGIGQRYTFDPALLIPDGKKSVHQGAIELLGKWSQMSRFQKQKMQGVASSIEKEEGLSDGYLLKTPWNQLSAEHHNVWLFGTGERHITFTHRGGSRPIKYGGTFDGLVPQFLSQWNSYKNPMARRYFEKYMQTLHCESCNGERLNPQGRHVKLRSTDKQFKKQDWKSLPNVGDLPLNECLAFFQSLDLSSVQTQIAGEALKEICSRLGFLLEVGLNYLCLNRTAPTLSGGESQRIRLASQIGSGLVGVLYVLDEPSIGLHPRDNDRLLSSLQRLRDLGNTLIVVEHDEDTMREADMIVDFGPGPGVRGGEIVVQGSLAEVAKNKRSVTGGYLSGRLKMERPAARREGSGKRLVIQGATQNNLQAIDVSFPLGCFICVTGVSGSGKSSLVTDILTPALRKELNGAECIAGHHRKIVGLEHLDKVIDIDQSPIGRTPRSNPATYVKVFDEIRDLFARLPESKKRGYQPGRFSFNTDAGRCAACEGNGSVKLAMELVADLWVPCTICNGKRYDRETLQVTFKNKSIADCLELDVQEALEHFASLPKIADKLKTLHDVGLDYLKLGQPSPTLSGGEAQRIKLAKELSRRDTGRTLYVLDEPTTGLHFADIALLLKVLQSLVDRGNTVVVVEHNLDMIQAADWVIDLGPEGGSGGGRILAEGTPETIASHGQSSTGKSLAAYFAQHDGKGKKPTKVVSTKKRKSKSSHLGLQELVVHGASMHNLQHVHVTIPRNKMSVFCGPSGSGKTSLAMDTIYAEGQRRYVESLGAYARQFVGQMPKPVVERIDGLSPSVALEQRNLGHTPRSTVGTVTEIYDYLRVFMARLGIMHCPLCNKPVGTQTGQEITDAILSQPKGTKLLLMAPVAIDRTIDIGRRLDELKAEGFVRFRIDGITYPAEEIPELQRTSQHEIQVVVDRLKIDGGDRSRIADSVEIALGVGEGVLQIALVDDREEPEWEIQTHSRHLACHHCKTSYQPLTPHSFSFNSSLGWCPSCEGLGVQTGTNPTAFMDMASSLEEGGLQVWPDLSTSQDSGGDLGKRMLQALCRQAGIAMDIPLGQLPNYQMQKILFGTGVLWINVERAEAPRKKTKSTATQEKKTAKSQSAAAPEFRFQFRGVYPSLEMASKSSPMWRERLQLYVAEVACIACSGARVRPEAAACRWEDLTIVELVHLPLSKLHDAISKWKLDPRQQKIAGELLREVQNRLQFLVDVGLDYLTLSRSANSLSGGESQRIRLASQLGSGLCGILYVLDEPTIGLHPRDNDRLIGALHRLRDLGNTLLVVEHDKDVIASSDHLCDFGPGSGRNGGQVVGQGSPNAVSKQSTSVTGPYLSGKKGIPIPNSRRPTLPEPPGGGWLTVRGARENTLRGIDVPFPIGCLIAVTGPSGSGKSSLVNDILFPALAKRLHRAQGRVGVHGSIDGIQWVDKVVMVDQTPLGVSPASNPATYSGVFELIRQLYSQLPEARIRGFTQRQFSFNVPGGRCEKCEGNGQIKIEMHFLPDVWVECDSCFGRRYTEETLSVRYQGNSVYDLLEMPIGNALKLLYNIPKIRRILQTLVDVGLDYLALGQSAPTLSGGEAQRVKLASELARPQTGKTLYLLDEPTTGLHFDDIAKLLKVLHRLVDLGNTVVVIEHNLDVIKSCDWLIDMGPEAGWHGGQVVVAGTPEQVRDHGISKAKKGLPSYTGIALDPILKQGPFEDRIPYDPSVETIQHKEDLSITQIGKMSIAPWEADGRNWHLVSSKDRKGNPPKWDRRILAEIIARIEKSGCFAETNWNSRSIVEVTGHKKTEGWFLHAITAETWLLKLKFRVPRGAFTKAHVLTTITLPTLNEIDEVEAYSNDSRVIVKTGSEWQEVEIRPYRFEEIDRPGFWKWLDLCIKAFDDSQGPK